MLKLVLDDYEFGTFDYGAKTLRNFKIYTEAEGAFDATGYTATIKISKDGIQRISDITGVFDTIASGLGHFQLGSPAQQPFQYMETWFQQVLVYQMRKQASL